ncbi:MAG: TIGR03085 family protein [Frankia sp.]|nr:TIGR03085 family protein [Frankia sp.]
MGRARDERAALADVIEAAGPDHPTLCAGWTAYDLLAHVVTRERKPWAGPGLLIRKLHGITERAERATRDGHSFDELLRIFRSGAPVWHFSRIGPLDDATNFVEYLVHAEDVRRAGPTDGSAGPAADGPLAPRKLDAAQSEQLWRMVSRMARMAFRRVPVGVVLERTDGGGEEPARVVARRGEPAVVVAGPAAELLLYAYGRRSAAKVELRGDAERIAALEAAPLGI